MANCRNMYIDSLTGKMVYEGTNRIRPLMGELISHLDKYNGLSNIDIDPEDESNLIQVLEASMLLVELNRAELKITQHVNQVNRILDKLAEYVNDISKDASEDEKKKMIELIKAYKINLNKQEDNK